MWMPGWSGLLSRCESTARPSCTRWCRLRGHAVGIGGGHRQHRIVVCSAYGRIVARELADQIGRAIHREDGGTGIVEQGVMTGNLHDRVETTAGQGDERGRGVVDGRIPARALADQIGRAIHRDG